LQFALELSRHFILSNFSVGIEVNVNINLPSRTDMPISKTEMEIQEKDESGTNFGVIIIYVVFAVILALVAASVVYIYYNRKRNRVMREVVQKRYREIIDPYG